MLTGKPRRPQSEDVEEEIEPVLDEFDQDEGEVWWSDEILAALMKQQRIDDAS